MKYRLEIWQYHCLTTSYESNNIKKVLKWYQKNWKDLFDYGYCTFYLFKNNEMLDFNKCYELGFFKEVQ